MNSDAVVKPLATAAAAFAIDKLYFKETDMKRSAMFAASVGAGVYIGSMVGQYAPDFQLPMLGSGKSAESRILEIALGGGAAYALNKYVLKNDYSRDDMLKRLGTIVVADFAGEIVADYVAGRPIAIFG
jgi:hypothetical protein